MYVMDEEILNNLPNKKQSAVGGQTEAIVICVICKMYHKMYLNAFFQ